MERRSLEVWERARAVVVMRRVRLLAPLGHASFIMRCPCGSGVDPKRNASVTGWENAGAGK